MLSSTTMNGSIQQQVLLKVLPGNMHCLGRARGNFSPTSASNQCTQNNCQIHRFHPAVTTKPRFMHGLYKTSITF